MNGTAKNHLWLLLTCAGTETPVHTGTANLEQRKRRVRTNFMETIAQNKQSLLQRQKDKPHPAGTAVAAEPGFQASQFWHLPSPGQASAPEEG